ncbi:MAG: alpha-2-macroglobulin [Hyphomonadaceae bacterium]
MNRNVILAAAVALMAGLWGGVVLGRAGGGAPQGVFSAATPGNQPMRAADAPRPGPQAFAGMAFLRLRIDSSAAQPKACLEFSRNLSTDPQIRYADYLAIDPAAAVTTEVAGNQLCLSGLPYEPDRQVTIRQGLPSDKGERTARDETITLSFGDRPAFVGFAGNGVILPRTEADGLGIETVNVAKLKIEVLRVSDRILARQDIDVGQAIAEGSWDWYSFENAGDDLGAPVYKGELVVAKDAKALADNRNQSVTTVFPLGTALKQFKPGAYVVKVYDVSSGAGARGENNDRPAAAHRWILYTDMALQSFSGAGGMDVVVRSLATARPMQNVAMTLIAANNDELARVRVDSQGRARFPGALLKGEGALRPRYVMAYGPAGDFTALDLERPTLDLSDRNVAGRPAAGDVDAFLYTDRGIYRPGETVRLAGLIRDSVGRAISDRQSVLVVYRPNGTEARRQRLAEARDAGAIIQSVAIDRSAPRGQWRAELLVDGQDAAAGTASWAVEDFVPQRLKVEAKADERPMRVGETRAIEINARFLYGAPGAGLPIEGEARLQVDPSPFPNEKDFRFGKEDETFEEKFVQLDPSVTDGDGNGRLMLHFPDAPATTLPLRAKVVASVSEPGGRTVREGLDVPVRASELYLGVKPMFDSDHVQENTRAAFELIAVDPAGRRIAARGVTWQLVEEDWSYDWYLEYGQWKWRRTGRDIPVAGASGRIDLGGRPVTVARDRLASGSYRLVLRDAAGTAETSYRFYAGWGATGGDADTPDAVTVAGPADAVKPGAGVRVEIRPPYAGEAQIVVATDRVLEMRTMRVSDKGAVVNLRADKSWGAGAYVLVTVMTPRAPATAPVPRRGVGVVYVPVDMSARTIKVDLAQNLSVVRPRQRVSVPITVSGAPGGENVRLTLAAVDEGILGLTKFKSPDPAAWYFGKKALGVGLRDDYGRLLNPNLGAPTAPRQGGDGIGGEGLTVVPTKTVAIWTGLVRPDKSGKVSIPLDLPDFNGELRLMAVAWSESAVGSASKPLTVRDPVVAELTLPRFIAPGDSAFATLELSNVEGGAGAYTVRVSSQGAVSGAPYQQTFNLGRGAQSRARVPVSGGAAGLGKVSLAVDGPNFHVERAYDIQSRTPFLPVTDAETQAQASNVSFTLAPNTLDAFAAGEARATVSYSNLRGLDPAPLLDVLERYPYGCSEQLTSTAMPLLYANALAAAAKQRGDPRLRARVQDAVNKLLDRQGSDGSFGLWREGDRAASPWLGAYVVDFLRRAKASGAVVPNATMDMAYQGLRAVARLDDFANVSYDFDVYQWPGSNDSKELLRSRAAAYALYVLAKGGKVDVGQVRYFHDAKLKSEPSPLARAQIGAALAHLGDRARAANAFRMAEQALGYRNTGDYYQTPLRDLAGVLALAAEAGQTQLVERLAARLEREQPDADRLMTQEQAQLLIAADALLRRAGPVSISMNGAPPAAIAPVIADAARIAQGLAFRNAAAGPVWRSVTLSGAPKTAPPASSSGFSLDKRYYTLGGASVDLGALRQGQRVVVVISGAPEGQRLHPTVLVDLLPAGLEIESVLRPEDGEGEPDYRGERRDGAFGWVGKLTPPRVAEARDDRFVTAADVRGQSFRFGYIARAVTPGSYAVPGAQVEDMYRPGVYGRTGAGRVTIASGQ